MTATVAAHSAAGAHIVSDTAFFWIETVMVVVSILGLIAGYFIARSNKRMAEETQRRREQRRAEQVVAEANIDALAGRPEQPQPDPDAWPANALHHSRSPRSAPEGIGRE